MAAKQQQPEHMFDVRVIEARIRRGTVTADAYKAYLESLPDEAEQADPVKTTFTSPYGDQHYRRR